MSLSAIGSALPVGSAHDLQSPVPTAAPSKPAGNSIPTDTVSISSAAQRASRAGDVDHDGDSH